jgi:NAD+ kinase
MKIGVLGKITKIGTEETMQEILSFLKEMGHETVRFSSHREIDGVDLVVVLGGDGAILHAAVPAAQKGIKIIGINYGNLGFLTEYEKDEYEQIRDLLNQRSQGTCRILKRSLLQCEVAGKIFYALNEIALQRDYGLSERTPTQILKLETEMDAGKSVVSGDGLLVCTPTGSTAYSLSAGGAILTPDVPVFMMTPICAFSMRSRPIVFSDDKVLTVKITRGRAILLADGLALAGLPETVQMKIRKAPFTADFPVRDGSDFFAKIKNKLSE